MKRAKLRLALSAALGLGLAVGTSSVAFAGPPAGMPDPSRMSGIPRPDPQLAPGTVTVRCLDGSFANPAIGVTVTLEVQTAGGETKRLEAQTVEQGRASFSIAEHIGATVTASATIGDKPLRSQSFALTAQAGVALLLVRPGNGAGAAAGTPPQGAPNHGGQGAVPMPGKPFALAGRPAGQLIVGALDLGRNAEGEKQGELGPIEGVEIRLEIRRPEDAADAEPEVRKATSDAEGRVSFEGLNEALPAGSVLVVEATLEDGAEPTRSQELTVGAPDFRLGTMAYAVVLAKGAMPADGAAGGAPSQAQPPVAPPPRMALPGPRVDKSLSRGQVRVLLVDARDKPVANQLVTVHSSQTSGDSSDRSGTTDERGEVIIDGVTVDQDTLAQVRVVHDGAPYSSTLFEMPEAQGAIVPLRVFEATSDRQRVRSALQIDVLPRENDFASVTFMYAVFVDGDEAFWVPGGMRLHAPDGTKSVHVLPEAEDWLFHDGEAPWVDVDRPLLPGQEIRLSFAVGIQHDGSLELDWSAPFPLVPDASIVSVPAELDVTHGVAGAPEVNPHAGRDGGPIELYKLGHDRFVPRICDYMAAEGHACNVGLWGGSDMSVVVEGLPVRSRIWPYTAWFLLALGVIGTGLGIGLRPRVSPREALLKRRDTLIAALVEMDATQAQAPAKASAERGRERKRLVEALDRVYRQLEALGADQG